MYMHLCPNEVVKVKIQSLQLTEHLFSVFWWPLFVYLLQKLFGQLEITHSCNRVRMPFQ